MLMPTVSEGICLNNIVIYLFHMAEYYMISGEIWFFFNFLSLLRPPFHGCYLSGGRTCVIIYIYYNLLFIIYYAYYIKKKCEHVYKQDVAPKFPLHLPYAFPTSHHTEVRWRETRVDNPKTRPSAHHHRCLLLSSLVYCASIPLTKLTVDGRHLTYNPQYSSCHPSHRTNHTA